LSLRFFPLSFYSSIGKPYIHIGVKDYSNILILRIELYESINLVFGSMIKIDASSLKKKIDASDISFMILNVLIFTHKHMPKN